MIHGKTVLAIIPARSGSKRLSNKNIIPINGKPMIEWSILAAQGSDYIDKIIVSTDSVEIGGLAERQGVIYLNRPKYLANDDSTSAQVVLHALEVLDIHTGFFMLLQPTSPLRTSVHINEACQTLSNKDADAVVSVCKESHPPHWSNTIPADGSLANFINPENVNSRSQDFAQHYRLNGAIYLTRINRFKKEKTFILSSNTFSYIMPLEYSVDIDDEFDFLFAQFLFNYNSDLL